MDKQKKIVWGINTSCLALVIAGIVFIVGGILAYRALNALHLELTEGKYSLGTLHSLLHIQSSEDLVSTELDIYKATLKYRELGIMQNEHLLKFMRILVLIGLSILTIGISIFRKFNKLKKQAEPGVGLYGENAR
jgi:hypothetical protein